MSSSEDEVVFGDSLAAATAVEIFQRDRVVSLEDQLKVIADMGNLNSTKIVESETADVEQIGTAFEVGDDIVRRLVLGCEHEGVPEQCGRSDKVACQFEVKKQLTRNFGRGRGRIRRSRLQTSLTVFAVIQRCLDCV